MKDCDRIDARLSENQPQVYLDIVYIDGTDAGVCLEIHQAEWLVLQLQRAIVAVDIRRAARHGGSR